MLTVLGPTACGKTTVAVALAANFDAEIISADSRQVYKRMDIGTGKDLAEYFCNGRHIPYHLIDIVEPGSHYNLFRYQNDFVEAYTNITSRGKLPILCGGSGLYLEAVLRGYALSPVPQNDALRKRLAHKSLHELTEMLEELKRKNGSHMHNQTDVDTAQRAIRAIEIEQYNLEHPTVDRPMPTVPSVVLGVEVSREVRRERITSRLEKRLQTGMIDEIKQLLVGGLAPESLIYYGLEYKYVTEYVMGKYSYDEMFKQLEIAIHQFAKRQMTWFRGMEKRGTTIHWMSPEKMMGLTLDDIFSLPPSNN